MRIDGGGRDALWVTKHVKRQRAGALRQDDARGLMLRALELYRDDHGLELLAWSILPSRVDLLIALPLPVPPAKAMKGLFSYFTRRYNRRYLKSGAVLRDRFLSRTVAAFQVPEAIDRILGYPAENELAPRPGSEPWAGSLRFQPAMTVHEPARLSG